MKTIAITILGILMSVSIFAENTIPPQSLNSENKVQFTKTQTDANIDLICGIESEIISKQEEIKMYKQFIEIDGKNPIYLSKISELEKDITKLHNSIENLSEK